MIKGRGKVWKPWDVKTTWTRNVLSMHVSLWHVTRCLRQLACEHWVHRSLPTARQVTGRDLKIKTIGISGEQRKAINQDLHSNPAITPSTSHREFHKFRDSWQLPNYTIATFVSYGAPVFGCWIFGVVWWYIGRYSLSGPWSIRQYINLSGPSIRLLNSKMRVELWKSPKRKDNHPRIWYSEAFEVFGCILCKVE